MQELLAELKNARWSRRGTILPIFALTFALLLLFLGLVVDGGIIYFERRRAQAAADAGAYGGALELLHNNDVWVDDAGKADAKMNGFDDDDADIVVTVNNPPLTGSAAGDNNAVEVIVQSTVATTLMQLVANNNSIVRARAVAAVGPGLGTTVYSGAKRDDNRRHHLCGYGRHVRARLRDHGAFQRSYGHRVQRFTLHNSGLHRLWHGWRLQRCVKPE